MDHAETDSGGGLILAVFTVQDIYHGIVMYLNSCFICLKLIQLLQITDIYQILN